MAFVDSVEDYDAFAAEYNALFEDFDGWTRTQYQILLELLLELAAARRVLDCACGTGAQTRGLARHGHEVTTTDASAAMVRETANLLRNDGLEAAAAQCRWESLPVQLTARFDVVLCCGNALAHSPGLEALQRNVDAMAAVLDSAGALLVESRNWERMLDTRPRHEVLPQRTCAGERLVPI